MFNSSFQRFLADDKVYRLLDHRGLLIVILGHIIRLLVVLDHRLGLLAKDINIIVANQLVNLHVRTVGSAECYSAV